MGNSSSAPAGVSSFYELSATDIDGNDFKFENLRGKVIMACRVEKALFLALGAYF